MGDHAPKPWDEAVAEAAAEPYAGAAAAVVSELVCLWSDLDHAVGQARNSCWSLGCDSLARRIVQLTQVTGPARWQAIPPTLLLNGVYQGLMASAGVVLFDEPDMDELRAIAAKGGYSRCAECDAWSGSHQMECPARPRTPAEMAASRVLRG